LAITNHKHTFHVANYVVWQVAGATVGWDEVAADPEWPFDATATRFDLATAPGALALVVIDMQARPCVE
jgi:hypothetical protein